MKIILEENMVLADDIFSIEIDSIQQDLDNIISLKELRKGTEYYSCAIQYNFAINCVRIANHPAEVQKNTVYDRDAIESWLKSHNNSCPFTRTIIVPHFESLTFEQILFALDVENKLKARSHAIKEWAEQHVMDFNKRLEKQQEEFNDRLEVLKKEATKDAVEAEQMAFNNKVQQQKKDFEYALEKCKKALEPKGKFLSFIEGITEYLYDHRKKNEAFVNEQTQILQALLKGNYCEAVSEELLTKLASFGIDFDLETHHKNFEKIRKAKEKAQRELERKLREEDAQRQLQEHQLNLTAALKAEEQKHHAEMQAREKEEETKWRAELEAERKKRQDLKERLLHLECGLDERWKEFLKEFDKRKTTELEAFPADLLLLDRAERKQQVETKTIAEKDKISSPRKQKLPKIIYYCLETMLFAFIHHGFGKKYDQMTNSKIPVLIQFLNLMSSGEFARLTKDYPDLLVES